MKFKYLLCIIALTAITKNTFAQYSQDVIRYSTFQPGSTSRIKALGNAGTAIGGDLSSIGNNPAGLGFFTKSELSITPEFDGSKVNSSFLNQSNSASSNTVNLNNISWEFYNRLNTPSGQDKTKGWLSLNFGVAYNRTNDYGENIYAGGKNSSSSITDYYANLANSSGSLPDGSLQSWAYNQNLIDLYGTTNPIYKSNAYAGVSQLNSISRSGGQSEFDFSMGANYSNKLYLGIGLAITNLQFNSTNNFSESGTASVLENDVAVNRNYTSTYSQLQNTNGSGVNVKLGVIYKLLESVRLGIVVTSPTYYSIDDSYNESLSTNLSSGASYADGPAGYPLNYSFTSPPKIAGGLAIFIKQFGFITGDVEYIDYTATNISNYAYDSSTDNTDIRTNYRAAVNAHMGAEARLPGGLFLRGGFGVQGSPLKQNGAATQTISGGLGYHFGSYYADITYTHVTGSESMVPYNAGSLTPTANLSSTNNNLFLTFGYRY